MGKNRKVKRAEARALSASSLLADNFVPSHLNEINKSQVYERWILCNNDGGVGDDNPNKMGLVIKQMAENFIPRVPCSCGPQYWQQSHARVVPPDLRFALMDDGNQTEKWQFYQADLDETTSIQEYSSTFRCAIRSEHEELMRLFEKYTLFKQTLTKADGDEKRANIEIEGISDARPSLQIGDIVLLRPHQPLLGRITNWAGTMEFSKYNIEIETRILSVTRGKRNNLPDQVTIAWDLNIHQIDALKDHAWVREYAIRFVPSSTIIDRSLTALDWLEVTAATDLATLQTILFPIEAPVVKPLTPEERQITVSAPSMPNYSMQVDTADLSKPLNDLQADFVRMVRARTMDPSFGMVRPPMILTGPAGTGKTKTLIYAIADCLGLLGRRGAPFSSPNNNRVLICCPSHAASDVLTRRLSGLLKRSEIFRMYDSSRPSNTVPGYILPFTCQIPGSDRFTLPPPSVWSSFKAIICTCADSHILYRSQLTNNSIRVKQQCFRTFLMSGSSPIGLSFGDVSVDENPFFTHLFIDEAAQSTEPEILCPISCVVDTQSQSSRRKAVEIVMVGDPRQLSPRVYSSKVADTLGRSFMERLLRRPVRCMGGGEDSLLGPTKQPDYLLDGGSLTDLIRYYASVDGQEQLSIFLTQNYRGHPSFLMMPSSFFYFDRLRCAKSTDQETITFWCDKLRKVEALSSPVDVTFDSSTNNGGTDPFAQIRRQTTWPMHFRGVKGQDTAATLKHFAGTDSWMNMAEAYVVLDIVSALVEDGLDPARIGCMAPFRGQVAQIRNLLREKYLYDVNVGTVENYQAVQQDVIILSLTRANHVFIDGDVKRRMGLYQQPKNANVALTRAENLFIVVGDPSSMWKDPCWKQYLRFMCRNGLWYGEGLKQWRKTENNNVISMKDMHYVSTLDLTKKNVTENVVVSTLEKITRA